MPRLERGQNEKIDMINDYVEMVQSDDPVIMNEGLVPLLELFNPLFISICNKWSRYFDDTNHGMIPWDSIMADCQYWFLHYTKNKYEIDGPATFNKFIKDHINQRVRYIYECELGYRSRNIFPDPDKRNEDGNDMFEDVVFNYTTPDQGDMTDSMIDDEYNRSLQKLHDKILTLIGDERYFSARDSKILIDSMVYGKTHDNIGKELGISRTRVSQLMSKIKKRLQDVIMDNPEYWEVR